MTVAALRVIAHSRAGDKGNLNSLSVIGYDQACYRFLERELTAAAVADHLAFRVVGRVDRFTCPALRTVHFVVERSAADTVTTSTFADTHGKSLSSALLELELDIPAPLLTARERHASG